MVGEEVRLELQQLVPGGREGGTGQEKKFQGAFAISVSNVDVD